MNLPVIVALVGLLLAAFLRILERAAGKAPAWKATLALWISLACILAILINGAKEVSTSSGGAFSLKLSLETAAFVLALACAWLEWRFKETFFSLFALPVSAALLFIAGLLEKLLLGDQFKGTWFVLHVGFSIAGECFFFLAALAGISYLIVLDRLKEKNRLRAIAFFPPLLRLDTLMTAFLKIGCVLFATGLAAGFVWSWFRFSIFDPFEPKKALAVIVLLLFGIVSALRRFEKISGPNFAWGILAGFLLSMILTFGIDSSAHWFPR